MLIEGAKIMVVLVMEMYRTVVKKNKVLFLFNKIPTKESIPMRNTISSCPKLLKKMATFNGSLK